MKRNTLTVPKNGTETANYQTPLDNLISGANSATSSSPGTANTKRAASFNLDKTILADFKAKCAKQGVSMSAEIEKFMKNYKIHEVKIQK